MRTEQLNKCLIIQQLFFHLLFFYSPLSPLLTILRSTRALSQARLDFRDPLMVSLEFGLADEDQGPVLDENLPKSINKTVRQYFISLVRVSLCTF